MTQVDDLSRSLAAFDQNTSLIVVVEMSEASWLLAGLVPGVDRQPLKKLAPDPDALLRLLERWQAEAVTVTVTVGQTIGRIALAYEAGRDGFWLARWLQARGIEVHVIHSTSVAVSRKHSRAKTDRLDTARNAEQARNRPHEAIGEYASADLSCSPNCSDPRSPALWRGIIGISCL